MQVEPINPIKMIAKIPESYRNTFNKYIFNNNNKKKEIKYITAQDYKWKANLF